MSNKDKFELAKKPDEFNEVDKPFPDGIYVEPGETKEPKAWFRELSKYCAEHGINLKDLTDEERKMFIYDI